MDDRAFARFRKNRGAMAGLVIVIAIVLFSVVVPWLSSHGRDIPDFDHGRGPYGTPASPSARHLLGTDTVFRDLLVRLAYGGRLSLEVAFLATLIAMGIGTGIGVLSGYFKGTRVRLDRLLDATAMATAPLGLLLVATGATITGHRFVGFAAWCVSIAATLRLPFRLDAALSSARRASLALGDLLDTLLGVAALVLFVKLRGDALSGHVVAPAMAACGLVSFAVRARAEGALRVPSMDLDDVAMRAVDVLLSFPFLLLLMALSAAIDRTTLATIFLVLGLTAWTGTARVIRGKTLQLRELEFITASRALGQSTPRILVRHILPNVSGLAIVLATNSVAGMIVAEAALSFLGLSIPAPAASWGRMLDEGRPYVSIAPWLLVAPAIAILLAVLGFNLLGEGLRDAFDPKDA